MKGSLRFRLLAGAAAWIAAALAAAGLLISHLFAEHAARRLDAELTAHLNQLAAALAVGPQGEIIVAGPLSDPRFRRPLSGLYWRVEPGEGEALRSRSLWDQDFVLPADDAPEAGAHRHRRPGPMGRDVIVLERMVRPADGGGAARLAAAADAAELDQAAADFNRPLAWSLAALWAALTAAAVAQVQVGLRPLARLRADLMRVRAGEIARLPPDAPREVAPVAAELNAVLDHDAAVVARARLEAGNLAHALKTDLAILHNDAENLAAADMAQRVERMTRQIDRHMARARAAASIGAAAGTAGGAPRVRTPVAATAERLLRAMARLHAERSLTLVNAVPPGLQFYGDAEDLTEMLGALLDNACKWATGRVEATARPLPGGLIELVVVDDGPGLPEAARAAVLQAGVRLDESAPGAGLGLAVTLDLALLYGGGLSLEPAAPGAGVGAASGGLAARLRLPGGGGGEGAGSAQALLIFDPSSSYRRRPVSSLFRYLSVLPWPPACAHCCPGFGSNKISGNLILRDISIFTFSVMRGLDPRIASQPLR